MKLLWLAVCLPLIARGQDTSAMSSALDGAMETAIRSGLIPGGVLIVGHQGRVVHRKAYGNRAVVPAREAMTLDTIFDIASLTKVTATTP